MYKSAMTKVLFLMLVSLALSASALAQKVGISNSQRPAGKAKTVKNVPVPKNWVYMYDSKRGYGFYLPAGSVGSFEKVKGIDVYVAATPAPSEISVIVLAYKDKTLTKDDLLDDAVDFLEGMGETVEVGTLTAESEDYALADGTTIDEAGKKSKVRVLVGTDITDNYVMIIGTDASKFAANKNIIDMIWGSFEMWSGGASGKS